MQKHNQQLWTNEHSSLEKYISHTLFSKGLRKGWYWLGVRGELETEQTATYWPQVPLTIAALLPHSAGLLNPGPEGPGPLSEAGSHCLERQIEHQLTQAVCGTWLYNFLTSTCFLWASQLHRIQTIHRSRWYPDIFDQMHQFLGWRLGRGSVCYPEFESWMRLLAVHLELFYRLWFGFFVLKAYQPSRVI